MYKKCFKKTSQKMSNYFVTVLTISCIHITIVSHSVSIIKVMKVYGFTEEN